MLRTSRGKVLAKVYGVPWAHEAMTQGHMGTSLHMRQAKEREGRLHVDPGRREPELRRALDAFAAEPKDRKRFTSLPGVEFDADLPADPLTRIFFQRKGDHALFQGTFENPTNADPDRVQLKLRTK